MGAAMVKDMRYVIWRLVFKSKEPPPHWQRKRRSAAEILSDLFGLKKRRSAQSLSMREF